MYEIIFFQCCYGFIRFICVCVLRVVVFLEQLEERSSGLGGVLKPFHYLPTIHLLIPYT